ncbi:hypothetical protein BH09PAT4_BH09PAT4_03270 [soil metagenome]
MLITIQNQFKRLQRKRVVVMAAIVIVVIFGATLYLARSTGQYCLTADDYKDLTGAANDELQPTTSFYSYTIEFGGGSTAYTNTITPSVPSILEKIGTFYDTHKNRSLIATITSTNNTGTSRVVADKRSAKIKDDLVAAGFNAGKIMTAPPTFIDGEPGASDIATITLTSASECREQ